MNVEKIRKITKLDIQNIKQIIKENGLYQTYYSLKDKNDLSRQDRLLLGYLNPNYLRNNDLLDEVTIPMIQKELRKILKDSPEQIVKSIREIDKINQEKLRYEEERKQQKQRELLEKQIVKTIQLKGTYPYSDGEGFSTTMYILLEICLDLEDKLVSFNILDLQPQHSFYEIRDYKIENKRLFNYLSSKQGKTLKDTISFITVVSKNQIEREH